MMTTTEPPTQPHPAHAGPGQMRRLLEAVVAVGSGLELPVVLRRVVEAATQLAGARYGALGVLDAERTRLVEFITVGVDDQTRAAIGELPKGHGLLGLLITDPRPIRVPDLGEHPERFGFPPNHPPMTSFLGVPIYVRGEVFGNLYLTDKRDGEAFTDVDEELVTGLAAAAAIAIDNARLHERTRQLSVVAEQERIGRDLHDTVVQRLFATGLAMQATAALVADPLPRERLLAHIDDLDTTIRQIRSAIFELDSAGLAGAGLRREVLAVAAEAARVLGFEPEVILDGPLDTVADGAVAAQVAAVLREGLSNVARHAKATRVEVAVGVAGGELRVEIVDDGVGIGGEPMGGNGLRNLARRAEQFGGHAHIGPGPDGGTTITWVVPLTA